MIDDGCELAIQSLGYCSRLGICAISEGYGSVGGGGGGGG